MSLIGQWPVFVYFDHFIYGGMLRHDIFTYILIFRICDFERSFSTSMIKNNSNKNETKLYAVLPTFLICSKNSWPNTGKSGESKRFINVTYTKDIKNLLFREHPIRQDFLKNVILWPSILTFSLDSLSASWPPTGLPSTNIDCSFFVFMLTITLNEKLHFVMLKKEKKSIL